MKCLQKKPEKRFQTMEDLKISLERFLPKKSEDRTRAFSSFLEMIFPPEGEDGPERTQFRRKRRISFGYAIMAIIALGVASVLYGYHNPVEFSSLIPSVLKEKVGSLTTIVQRDSFVKIVVYPWAKVSIDGKYVDTTPIADPIRLKPGEHTLSFSHSKFKSKTIKIVLKPGETRLLSVRLGS
jgi:hypothetical protein